jgi:hypothetical protein
MASNKADCTLAGARLISSAKTKLAKIGPFFIILFNVVNHPHNICQINPV